MYCYKCGKQIDDEAIICPACGVPTQNFAKQSTPAATAPPPVTIMNSPSSSSSASSSSSSSAGSYAEPIRRKHNLLFDIFMIIITAAYG